MCTTGALVTIEAGTGWYVGGGEMGWKPMLSPRTGLLLLWFNM